TLSVRVDYKPRAPRNYEARMRLHTSKPCIDTDTTVLIKGDAFAPAFGLNFAFDTAMVVIDSFKAPSCDTVRIPIWSSRNIPANLVDIFLRIGHDTSELQFVGAESYYMSSICNPSFLPQIINTPGPHSGVSLICKNFCGVDSTQPFMFAKFISKTGQNSSTSITVDSIRFDTEESIRFNIIAGNDNGHITIEKADIAIRDLLINFDSVRVLDCKDTTLTVVNTGIVPLIIDSLPNLPQTVKIISSNPPSNIPIQKGDSIIFTVRYCPQRSDSLSHSIQARSIDPCTILDTVPAQGRGYAPDMTVAFGVHPNFTQTDTIYGSFNDTVSVPIYVEKDIAATYLGTTYWMKALSFTTTLFHNPTALKFLGYSIPQASNVSATPDSITMQFTQLDTLAAGKLGELYFKVVVPDTVISSMSIKTYDFRSDSLQFLDISPIGTASHCKVGGQCGITTLKFIGLQPSLQQNAPNPFSESSVISFTVQEKSPVVLHIFDTQGKIVKTILDGSKIYSSGTYTINFSANELESGVYFYEIQTGIFRQTKMMMIAR
ncbi:MAG TPA: T9SS type A sorting domain-containing protein, partial [Candidatus Kapabacteria bacterium]|nr:T9SS type A sorting domain-containing protein [Candidatus Kapabacteria bacterium]